jgi:hypothetical protein
MSVLLVRGFNAMQFHSILVQMRAMLELPPEEDPPEDLQHVVKTFLEVRDKLSNIGAQDNEAMMLFSLYTELRKYQWKKCGDGSVTETVIKAPTVTVHDTVRRSVAARAPTLPQEMLLAQARQKGYEAEPCRTCTSMTLVRNGVCLKCDTCGETSGCS